MSKRSRTRDWQKHHNTRDACADWLAKNGTAVIIDTPDTEEDATSKRK